MTARTLRCLVACIALAACSAIAQTGTYNPETPADPATEARLRALSQELRCLVCQNQTIADSNADLAVDLRREVRDQILKGRSDTEIKSYLVARYGDFVLYNPPVQANTALLWFGPLALLVTGGLVWWVLIRRRARSVPASQPTTLDDEQRAKRLLES
jgi:cytochrome c-type biogenesis protein CcmH